MPSITSWTKLELRTRTDDPAAGLAARLRDPLWMLARQWQVGEFTSEDAGSPLQVRAHVECAPITRWLPGDVNRDGAAGLRYDPARVPLEVLIEREPPAIDLRLACEAGLQFLRFLDHHAAGRYRSAYVAQYPLQPGSDHKPLNDDSVRLLRIGAGRIPDGARLANELRGAQGALPSLPAIAPEDRERLLRATQAWLAWLDGVLGTLVDNGAAAWNPERMEYSFAVAAPAVTGEHVLVADAFSQGQLDWHLFDRRRDASIGASVDAAARVELTRTAIPAPVRYRGMPVARWWEFEDGQVNLAAVDAGPTDLLRLLMLGFALDYGNDWFIAPVELPAGAIYRITSLVVTDSFGERTLVRPYTKVESPGARWRMFSLSVEGDGADDNEDLLFVPPSLFAGLHGEPIEQVLLLRDEVANLAWAVERIVEEAAGRPLDRFEHYQAGRSANALSALSPSGAELNYRLTTTVPDYWLPLVPMRVDVAQPNIRLVRGRVLIEGSTTAVLAPLGRLLEPGRPLRIFEEEVPRAGVRVTRSYQYARWTDGSAHLWIGRQKNAGRGEGSSGLRFDTITPSR